MTIANGQAIATEHPYQGFLDLVLHTLGEPVTSYQKKAFAAYERGDSKAVKAIANCDSLDLYLKALGYLTSVKERPSIPNIDTVMKEAVNTCVIARVRRDEALYRGHEEYREELTQPFNAYFRELYAEYLS